MTATTTTRKINWHGPIEQKPHKLPVAASTKIPAGVLVMMDSDGLAKNPASAVTNRGVCGVSVSEADNSSGSDGDVDVNVAWGIVKMGATSVTEANSLYQKVYATDNQTVDETNAGNRPLAGICVKVVSATECWVYVNGAQNALG